MPVSRRMRKPSLVILASRPEFGLESNCNTNWHGGYYGGVHSRATSFSGCICQRAFSGVSALDQRSSLLPALATRVSAGSAEPEKKLVVTFIGLPQSFQTRSLLMNSKHRYPTPHGMLCCTIHRANSELLTFSRMRRLSGFRRYAEYALPSSIFNWESWSS